MKNLTIEEIQGELAAIDSALAALPGDRGTVLDRVVGIMTLAQAAGGDSTKATFVLGQVYEALYPVRTRERLESRRETIVKASAALAGQ